MHRNHIVPGHLPGVNRGMQCKQFVADLRDHGFTCDQAIESVCLVFGVPRAAARLFVLSHPAWVADTPASDWDRSPPASRPNWTMS
jgi:hypothetical protein